MKAHFCGHCQRPIAIQPVFLNDIPYHWECTQSPYKQNESWVNPPTFGPLPKQPQQDSGLKEALSEAFSGIYKGIK